MLVAALAVPATAAAHVTLEPPYLVTEQPTRVGVEVPNERAPARTIGVTLRAPAGVSLAAEDTPGWSLTVAPDASVAHWSGGEVSGTATTVLSIGIHPRGRVRQITFVAEQAYDNGVIDRWRIPVILLPAQGAATPSQHFDRAVVVAVVGIGLIVASLAALHLTRRRRPLQNR